MSLKYKLISIIMAIAIALLFTIMGVYASDQIQLTIGGDISYDAPAGFTANITHNLQTASNNINLYVKVDDNEEVRLSYGESIEIKGKTVQLCFQSFSNFGTLSLKTLNKANKIEFYAPDPGWGSYGYLSINSERLCKFNYNTTLGLAVWDSDLSSPPFDVPEELIFDKYKLNYFYDSINGLDKYYILTYTLTENCQMTIEPM